MDISSRLNKIVEMVPSCEKIADIGTDHGYVLIALLKEHKIKWGIASDNKRKPLEKAVMNAEAEGVASSMDFRLGSGLETLRPDEVNGVVIAGMGGILIKELMEKARDVVKSLDFIVLQPAQNPELLREYLYENDYIILDEELVREERRYYEYMMVRYGENKTEPKKKMAGYTIGNILYDKDHHLLSDFMRDKIKEYEMILGKLDLSSDNAKEKAEQINRKINELRRIKDGCAG